MDEEKSLTSNDSITRGHKTGTFIALLVVLAAVVATVYLPVLYAQALSFDDDQYLTNNLLVQNPSWNSAKRFLTEVFKPSTVGGYYQPLTMISLMLDYSVAGDVNNLLPFHSTSLGLHVANALLVAVLLYVIFGRAWVAAICGLLFGLHPMTVETIAWVGEQKTLLASFFAFWSLLCYILFTKKGRWWYYTVSVATYFLSLLAKPTAITLPLLLILLDWWPLKRLSMKTLQEKTPFFVLAAFSFAVTLISQTSAGSAALGGEYGVENIWLLICHNTMFYPLKMLWPVNLSSFYPFPEPFSLSNPILIGSVVGTVILLAVLVFSMRWSKAPLAGWLFFFAAILPTIQIVRFSNVIASDKFAYLPSLGFLMLLAFGLGRLWDKSKVVLRAVILSMAVAIAGAEARATRGYLVHWKDTVSFCEYMLSHTPQAPAIHYMLGNALRDEGRLHEAYAHYQIVLAKEPEHPSNHCNYGIILAQLGRLDEALMHFEKAVTLAPDFAEAHYNFANALRLKGDIAGAISEYNKTLECKKDYVQAYNNLGGIYMEQEKPDEAISYFRQAIHYSPNYGQAHNNLGLALMQKGEIEQAIVEFQKAVEISPDYASARANLEAALQFKKSLSRQAEQPE
jgi:tetratricopeptide (TPR) repeat protein